jgi:broad specificity phosphatase PhoE
MRIRFTRHGKTNKAADGQPDHDRTLNQVGIDQANNRRRKLNGGKTADLVLSSTAGRALHTGKIISGVDEDEIVTLPELYCDMNDNGPGARLDVLFNKLGYAPPVEYLKEPDGACLTEWAARAREAIDAIMLDRSGPLDDIEVYGHAVCLPALAMTYCSDSDLLDFRKLLADVNLGECETIEMVIEDGKVTGMEVIAA